MSGSQQSQRQTYQADASGHSPEDGSTEPAKLESPLKPLLWLAIPFVLLMVYALFGMG